MIKTKRSRLGDWVIVLLCLILAVVCLAPLLNVVARSLSSSEALVRNEVNFIPKGLNFDAYAAVFTDGKYTRSLVWTAELTVICTVVSMVMTMLCAYPLTYDKLKGRKLINGMIILTMYFSAGIIPNYLLLSRMGMLDTASVLIIPNCLSVFNMIVMRSFFYGIPESLRESAEIDGASPPTILIRIYVPLSTSVLATLALFYAVGRWNGFSDALMYITKNREIFPIQLLLYNILKSTMSIEVSTQDGFFTPGISDTLKMATVVFATVPILIVYPWLQRYFVAGVTIGAVKG